MFQGLIQDQEIRRGKNTQSKMPLSRVETEPGAVRCKAVRARNDRVDVEVTQVVAEQRSPSTIKIKSDVSNWLTGWAEVGGVGGGA